MKKAPPAANPDAYVVALSGWQRTCVEGLRSNVLAAAKFAEVIKWGNLVYLSEGPVIVIRAEEKRVLFGFWRGKRLRDIDSRLKPGGKYEMATFEIREGVALVLAHCHNLRRIAGRLVEPTPKPQVNSILNL